MPDRPIRNIGQLRELGVGIHDPNDDLRALISGLLFGIGARKIFNLTTTRQMNEIPNNIQIALMLTNVGDSAEAGAVATSIRQGRLAIDPATPMIAYAVRPTIGLLKSSLAEWGFDEFLAVPISGRSLFAKLHLVLGRPRPLVITKSYIGPDNSKALDALDSWMAGRPAHSSDAMLGR